MLSKRTIDLPVRKPNKIVENAGKNVFRFTDAKLRGQIVSPTRILERNRIECACLGETLRRRLQIGERDGSADMKSGRCDALLGRVTLQPEKCMAARL
jgi:hypothetical protein